MRAAGKSSPCSSNSHHVPDTLLCPLCPHFFGLPASESSELYNICSWKRSLGAQNQNMTPRGFEHLRAICKGPRLKVDFFFKQSMHFGHQCLPGRRNWVSCGKSCRLPGHLNAVDHGGPWWTLGLWIWIWQANRHWHHWQASCLMAGSRDLNRFKSSPLRSAQVLETFNETKEDDEKVTKLIQILWILKMKINLT